MQESTAPQVFGHFWSLAVEEQFYLAWPLLIYLSSRRSTLKICAFCIALAPILRLVLMATGVGHPATAVLTPCRLDALAIGAWIAIAKRERLLGAHALVAAKVVFWCSLAVTFALFASGGWSLEMWTPAVESVGYTILDALFGAAIVLTLEQGWFGFFRNDLLRLFGKFSYMIYIIHVPLHAPLYKLFTMQHLTDALPPMPALIAFSVFADACCLGLASLCWFGYERHFLKLKSRFA